MSKVAWFGLTAVVLGLSLLVTAAGGIPGVVAWLSHLWVVFLQVWRTVVAFIGFDLVVFGVLGLFIAWDLKHPERW